MFDRIKQALHDRVIHVWYTNAASADSAKQHSSPQLGEKNNSGKVSQASLPLWLSILRPLEALYKIVVQRRRQQTVGWKAPVPVIVVGNITVGGTGKTPVVSAIVEYLLNRGHRPAVLSRGYGAQCDTYPYLVREDDKASWVGDEPALLKRRLGVPVCIDPDRARGARYLLQDTDSDVLVCDDGLQHYALQRDIEIAVIDGERQFGNGHCLPLGPLREPLSRLSAVHFQICNGADCQSLPAVPGGAGGRCYRMDYQAAGLVSLINGERRPVESLQSMEKLAAITGIGNPQRFFRDLRKQHIALVEKALPDHHQYTLADLDFANSRHLAIVMTEKDAVKCADLGIASQPDFAERGVWYWEISAQLPEGFYAELNQQLSSLPRQAANTA